MTGSSPHAPNKKKRFVVNVLELKEIKQVFKSLPSRELSGPVVRSYK
jgi:hypothetical protein